MRLLGMFFTICCLYFLGCLQTAQPLFHQDDLVFEDGLLGIWQDGDELWVFERVNQEKDTRPKNAYWLTITEKDSVVTRLNAHFGYVGDVSFLDVFDAEPKDLNLPLHLVYRAYLLDKQLILALPFDSDWFDKLPKQQKAVLRIEEVGDREVVLASTDVLQRFLKDHYRDGVSGETNVFTRLE
ncbi:MAG: hypothetical protein HOE48_06495 [Candidatus Latescibacteria bacterium]|jgi:hypothetical protein|nr:hypothetical protein [Candidatus Latescibacterota bacterium]MBT4137546.1 hypothetical protein [Candidatus Latescibacterota bacterium]